MNFSSESIFVSAVRSFCKSFATILGLLFGLVAIVITSMFFSSGNYLPEKSEILIMPDAHNQRELLPITSPAVLRINLHGVIGVGDLTSAKMESILLDSREHFLKNDRVKAILLHINTPGGTVSDSDAIYQALLKYKEKYQIPVYAYVDGLCASGGMYIACAADKIFASASSAIGSVGVIFPTAFNFSEVMAKHGITSLTLTEGKYKDMLNPFRPWVSGESESLQLLISAMYDRFVTVVSTARPNLDEGKLVREYGAQIFSSATAQKLGYIDVANSSYGSALSALVETASIKESERYQVVELLLPKPILPNLLQAVFNTGKMKHSLDLPGVLNPELYGKALYLYQP